MPVVTRSQAKAASQLQEPFADIKSPLAQLRKKSSRQTLDEDSSGEVLTPRSLNSIDRSFAPEQPMVKPSTALKAPFSHPLVEETSNLSLNDSPKDKNSKFTIPAVPASASSPAPLAAPTTCSSSISSQPMEATAIPINPQPMNTSNNKPFVPPEAKLLKPLPDKPVECTKLPDGPEPVVIEIEYPATADLQPINGDVSGAISDALKGIASPEWSDACTALVVIRRVSVHHKEELIPHLAEIVPHVVKSARSLRSALSKTAIMTLNDLYTSCPREMLPLSNVGGMNAPINNALAQLLLKSASNDKKFVIEEAQKTLTTMAESLSPCDFLSDLAPYAVDHKNPKVRGKAAVLLVTCIARFSPMEMHSYGLDKFLNAVAKLITDNTPEARDSAKKLAAALKTAFEDGAVAEILNVQVPPPQQPAAEGEEPPKELTKWEYWCQTVLGASKAASVLRAIG